MSQQLPAEYVMVDFDPLDLPEELGYGLHVTVAGVDCSISFKVDDQIVDLVTVDQSKGLVMCKTMPFDPVGHEYSEDEKAVVFRLAPCSDESQHIHVTAVAHPRIMDLMLKKGDRVEVLVVGAGGNFGDILREVLGASR